ncbi:MarR family winged helix-turn-helix transcriptional regulator [Paenibacillus allorhizosphaerae]|uniref:Transcriptional regulator SlyA n=1 Tax=Paenibacillus allorhizosphaerae TaxID=2849866 RepID=A0ABM8VIB4_9BACL|nr:MarR family transcriptional regulator [Paenibacillus allorhizosphaerae]CAG7643653.1 Transcriptional regulator SlyA [Paenibacillus allorhizosphaerae]
MIDRKNTIPRWVSLLYRYGQMYVGERLKHYDIGRGQYIFLNALYKEDGLSQEEISSDLKIDKGTTAKALKKLEEQGYIVRKVREEDKRSYRVFLTEKAMLIKDDVRSVLVEWRNILSEGLTEEEKRLALELLEKMGSNAARYEKDSSKS